MRPNDRSREITDGSEHYAALCGPAHSDTFLDVCKRCCAISAISSLHIKDKVRDNFSRYWVRSKGETQVSENVRVEPSAASQIIILTPLQSFSKQRMTKISSVENQAQMVGKEISCASGLTDEQSSTLPIVSSLSMRLAVM